ncbi:class I SAM-dependent methyltransferase [Variovorax soli]|uniref:SAM-dependent methyltransferase n=1 Tax=Variovorax soli TaxID=376815 RepID=A0ABU1N8T9_9BURK|nr:class I SAM-dependent methyltransferase [Variovorax soli]MDR6534727.1 SAM-dependent methyltransferase [Variovorax soli]
MGMMPNAPDSEPKAEALAVAERYARRKAADLYSILRPEVVLSTQEWQREMLFMFGSVCGYTNVDMSSLKLVDVGCGYGGHLLDFLRFGFSPQNLYGIELLPERVASARARLPDALKVHEGDASTADVAPASQDIVFQSVVFSSLLDDAFQRDLAGQMWSWVRPGGGVLWYDFVYDNPSNCDVRGVSIRRLSTLFPHGRMTVRRVTLAPPISRRVCRVHPAVYHFFNLLPFLRTHVLCWIAKD